jgi:hypothetical protein
VKSLTELADWANAAREVARAGYGISFVSSVSLSLALYK